MGDEYFRTLPYGMASACSAPMHVINGIEASEWWGQSGTIVWQLLRQNEFSAPDQLLLYSMDSIPYECRTSLMHGPQTNRDTPTEKHTFKVCKDTHTDRYMETHIIRHTYIHKEPHTLTHTPT